jgi:hypothetical protein
MDAAQYGDHRRAHGDRDSLGPGHRGRARRPATRDVGAGLTERV